MTSRHGILENIIMGVARRAYNYVQAIKYHPFHQSLGAHARYTHIAWRVFVIANLFAMKKIHPEPCDYAHAQCKVECHHRTANAGIHPNAECYILHVHCNNTGCTSE